MIRCVVFDFDGVLVESNHIKYQSFFDTLPAGVPGLHDTIRRVHAEGTYGDRFGLIRQVLESIDGTVGPESLDLDQKVAWFGDRYGEITEEAVSTCPEVPGASTALSRLGASLPLYVNSATPQGALRRIVQRRGWSGYFRDVLGGPNSKMQNLEVIMSRELISASQVLFVGDGRRDLEASQEIRCRFVAVRNQFNDFDTEGVEMIDDLSSLPDLLPLPQS